MIRFSALSFFFFLSFLVVGQISSQATELEENGIDNLFDESDFIPLRKSDHWAWYNISTDSISLDYSFTDFVQPPNGYCGSFVLKNDSMWGMMIGYGEEIVPFIYDSVIFVNNHLITRSGSQWTYHQETDTSKMLIQLELDSVYLVDNLVYIYANGKTGLILPSSELIKPKYDAIHTFGCGIDQYNLWDFFMTVNGTEFNLLDFQGEELLPEEVWDLRCTEDNVFEFRRGNQPEYYSPYSNQIISPNGRDIIFYGYRGYKIYSEDKMSSEFHLSDGTILNNIYDDYFILSEEFMAVRKNGKVGLLVDNKLRGQIKYDQITYTSRYDRVKQDVVNYFKFFQGDSCGLMNEYGIEKIAANYANIILTADDDRYVVVDNEICGVLDKNGRVVIPMKYDYIYYDDNSRLFVVQKNNRLGLFRRDGTELVPIIYEKHRMHFNENSTNLSNPIHVLGLDGKLYFANSKGLLDEKPSNHYDFTGNVLKVYGVSGIAVYALSKKGLVEEKLNYPLYKPTIVRKDYFNDWSGLSGWATALVEENQKEGYFGLRYNAKRGFGLPPKYRSIRPTSFNSFMGEVAFETDKINWLDTIPMKIIRSYEEVKIESAQIENYSLYNSETILPYDGTDNRRLNFELDRAQVFSSNSSVFSELELQELIHFGDCAGETEYVRRFIKGGKAEICLIDSADLSLYSYYAYWNLLDAVRVSPEMMKSVLNPKIGVRFKDAKQVVVNTFHHNFYKKFIQFSEPVNYEKFEFLTSGLFFEKSRTKQFGKLRKFRLDKNGNEEYLDSIILAKTVPGYIGEFIQASVPVSKMAKVHIDYPNFLFYQDSIDLSYNAGRITRRIDSSLVKLISPTGFVIADSCDIIRYLNEERFAVLHENEWQLIDENGQLVIDLTFRSVNEFNNNRADFWLTDGSILTIDSDGNELMPLPEPRIFLDVNHYYFASKPGELINQISNLKDKALDGEKYTSSGFFVSRNDGKAFVRRFGSEMSIELKMTSTLKSFGTCLYYQKGKHVYSIDSNLAITKFKKMHKFRMVTPEIGWLEGKKDWLIDSDWNYIIKMNKDQSFEMHDGNLLVLENDSLYRDFGSLKPINKKVEVLESTPVVKVVSENGKYGAKRGDVIVLPLNYSWLSKINDTEYLTRVTSENRLFNSSLDRIGSRPFDSFYQTGSGNFVFVYNGQMLVVSEDRQTELLIR